jgi:hypothetical protein
LAVSIAHGDKGAVAGDPAGGLSGEGGAVFERTVTVAVVVRERIGVDVDDHL